METITIITTIVSGIVGFAVAYFLVNNLFLKKKRDRLQQEALVEAESIKKEKILQAKEKFLQLKSEHEQQINERNNKVAQAENRIKQKEGSVNQQLADAQKKAKEADHLK